MGGLLGPAKEQVELLSKKTKYVILLVFQESSELSPAIM